MVLAVVLASLSFEPAGMWPLAWIALAPWLCAVAAAHSVREAARFGLLSGSAFFALNLWWMWTATIPGTVALALYFGLYWAAAAAAIRMFRFLPADGPLTARRAAFSVFAAATVWTFVEHLRAFLVPGFPWLLLGCSQTPALLFCQIADVTGVAGVTFCLALANAWVALLLLRRRVRRQMAAAAIPVIVLVGFVAAYGLMRLREASTFPGPRIMVVQPNHTHLRGGDRTVSREVAARFHLETTRRALANEPVDLIVWSETVMPPLNEAALRELGASPAGRFMADVHRQIGELARDSRATIITGANYVGRWEQRGPARVGTDLRNSVFCYLPSGDQSRLRYDKTSLVPFGERVPLAGVPLLNRLMLWLAPPVARQPLIQGDPSGTVVFTIATRPAGESSAGSVATATRFVTPVCLENASPPYVAGLAGSTGGAKTADLIVNLSNDGWFNRIQKWQHWQAVVFRCIENRVPMARSSNTGVSGFLDSCGRPGPTITPGHEGTAIHEVRLDRRMTFYTRHPEWFGRFCGLGFLGAGLVGIRRPRGVEQEPGLLSENGKR
jgi:apolipoprotein N-acyltransferase